MDAFFALDYTAAIGTGSAPYRAPAPEFVGRDNDAFDIGAQNKIFEMFPVKTALDYQSSVKQVLTLNYFQRVYDAGRGVFCYYTKTQIDASPSGGDTTPNYTGAISNHSVIKIFET